MVCLGEIGIQFQRPVKLLLGPLPVPIMKNLNRCQRRTRLGQRAVELQRLLGRCLGHGQVGHAISVKRKQRMGIRQAGISQREVESFSIARLKYPIASPIPPTFLSFQE